MKEGFGGGVVRRGREGLEGGGFVRKNIEKIGGGTLGRKGKGFEEARKKSSNEVRGNEKSGREELERGDKK